MLGNQLSDFYVYLCVLIVCCAVVNIFIHMTGSKPCYIGAKFFSWLLVSSSSTAGSFHCITTYGVSQMLCFTRDSIICAKSSHAFASYRLHLPPPKPHAAFNLLNSRGWSATVYRCTRGACSFSFSSPRTSGFSVLATSGFKLYLLETFLVSKDVSQRYNVLSLYFQES